MRTKGFRTCGHNDCDIFYTESSLVKKVRQQTQLKYPEEKQQEQKQQQLLQAQLHKIVENERQTLIPEKVGLLSPSLHLDACSDLPNFSLLTSAQTTPTSFHLGERKPPSVFSGDVVINSDCTDDAVQRLIEALSTSSWSSSEEF